MKVGAVAERTLTWVHGTLLSGHSSQGEILSNENYPVEASPGHGLSGTGEGDDKVGDEDEVNDYKNENNENDGCEGNKSSGKECTHHESLDNPCTNILDMNVALPSVNCIPISILPNHDVRIKLMTSNVISSKDNLYQAVCPGGVSPIRVDSTNRPTPSPTLKEGYRVSFARRVVSRKMFKFNMNDCSMVATISRCLHYEVRYVYIHLFAYVYIYAHIYMIFMYYIGGEFGR
jgi:hypothetical protein